MSELSLTQRVVFRSLRPLPPYLFGVLSHRWVTGEWSLLREPHTFTERIQARKLRNRDPRLTITADKFAVRAYVAERVGEQRLVPLIAVAADPAELRHRQLPRSFVIKATHGNNATLFVADRDQLDWDAAERQLRNWLSNNWYRYNKEWAYRNIPPRLVVEEFIGVAGTPPPDYKFFCFRGICRLIQVDTARFQDHRRDLFDEGWRRLDVRYAHPPADISPVKPANLAQMLDVAERLASDFDFVRVDLYSVDGGVLFGELTHYPEGGMKGFTPPQFDRALGELWASGTGLPECFYER